MSAGPVYGMGYEDILRRLQAEQGGGAPGTAPPLPPPRGPSGPMPQSPQGLIGGGPASMPAQTPQQAPQSQQEAAPQGFMSQLGQAATTAINNPLVQFGGGMMAAGGKGLNVGSGIGAGVEAMHKGTSANLQNIMAQRQLDALKTRDAAMSAIHGPNPPAWFTQLSPQVQGALKAMPPEQSMQLLAQVIGKQGDLSSALTQYKAQHRYNLDLEKQKMDYAKQLALQERQNNMAMYDRYLNEGKPGARRPAPQPGAVEDGHRFIGGDPADKNNWREINQ